MRPQATQLVFEQTLMMGPPDRFENEIDRFTATRETQNSKLARSWKTHALLFCYYKLIFLLARPHGPIVNRARALCVRFCALLYNPCPIAFDES